MTRVNGCMFEGVQQRLGDKQAVLVNLVHSDSFLKVNLNELIISKQLGVFFLNAVILGTIIFVKIIIMRV